MFVRCMFLSWLIHCCTCQALGDPHPLQVLFHYPTFCFIIIIIVINYIFVSVVQRHWQEVQSISQNTHRLKKKQNRQKGKKKKHYMCGSYIVIVRLCVVYEFCFFSLFRRGKYYKCQLLIHKSNPGIFPLW